MNKIFKSNLFWGLVGIIITSIFFYIGKNRHELIYYYKSDPSLIFDNSKSSQKIKLVQNDSVSINKNIYVANLVFWNNGNQEVKKADIRQDITISPIGNNEILDFKIIKQVDSLISKFKLIPKKESLILDWTFFDPGFATEVQIIYTSDKSDRLLVNGYILGSKIKEFNPNENLNGSGIIFISLFIVIVSLGFFYVGYDAFTKNRFNPKHERKTFLIVLPVLIFILIFWIYQVFNNYLIFYKPF